MKPNKVMEVELSTQNTDGQQHYYAMLSLPATMHEIRDACQRARFWDYTTNPKSITVMECNYPPQLDTYELAQPVTLDELNFYASRVDELPDTQKVALNAIFHKLRTEGRFRDTVSVKDLINMTYGLGDVIVVQGISSDRDLGEFVINNEMNPDVNAVPDQSLHLLDDALIGQTQREADQGVYIDDYYVATANYTLPEVYNGRVLPVTKAPELWYAFKLKIAEPPIAQPGDTEHLAEWISLPMEEDAAEEFARKHSEERIEDCVCYGMQSSIPQISDQQFFDMRDFTRLNTLAWRMAHMNIEEQCRFKAALELEQPSNMDELMDVADNLHKYEFSDTLDDADSYFRRVLAICIHPQFDKSWLKDLVCQSEGAEMLQRIGGMVTPYGVISGRDQPLYQMVARQAEEPAKTLTTQALTDEKLEVVEILGQNALFTNGRVTQGDVGDGIYCYELRSGEGITFATVEPHVRDNFSGTILMKQPLNFDGQSFIPLDEESSPNFLGYTQTVQEYMDTDTDQVQSEDETMDEEQGPKFGGM